MSAMLCPFCQSKTEVLDVRDAPNGGVRRRRECRNKHRYTTYENMYGLEPIEIMKIKQEIATVEGMLVRIRAILK